MADTSGARPNDVGQVGFPARNRHFRQTNTMKRLNRAIGSGLTLC